MSRSTRLRDLLLYITERVLEDEAAEIHEQEVGCKVFGRPADYDTSSDNIVRVHASMLRKRLEQYFAAEGSGEPLVLEIRRGNYAPVFHPRPELDFPALPPPAPPPPPADWRLRVLTAATIMLAISTAWLAVDRRTSAAPASAATPNVKALWSAVLRSSRPTDVVMDDAGVGLYQELTGHSVTLSEYFDRSYLRGLPGAASGGIGESAASAIVLRRQSSFAAANVLWKLSEIPGIDLRRSNLRFARDYSFRELKADDSILLGNSHTNPWVEGFEEKVGLRWHFDSAGGVYFPVDTWDGNRAYRADGAGDAREGFCAIALLPNLGGGNVLTIAGTGGSAVNAGAGFLADEHAIADLRQRLHGAADKAFPYFELLIRVKGRSASVKDAKAEIVRAPKR